MHCPHKKRVCLTHAAEWLMGHKVQRIVVVIMGEN